MRIIDELIKEKPVAVIRAKNKAKGHQLAKAIMEGDIKAIEITLPFKRQKH